jgi:PAS domain S-box-containing protein
MNPPASETRVLDAVSDGVMVIDRECRITYVNDAFCRLYGVSSGDAIGQTCRTVVDGDVCDEGKCLFRAGLEDGGEEERSAHNVYCRRNEVGPLCISCSLLRDEQGKTVGAVEIHKDMAILGEYIEATEAAHRQVEQDRQTQDTILAGIADGVFTVDEERRITAVNDKCLEMLGRRRQDVLGQDCCTVLRSSGCSTDCPIRWALENRTNVIDHRERILGAGDRSVEVLNSVFLVSDPAAPDARVVGVLRDVSEYWELKRAASQRFEYFGMVSRSPRMQEVFRLVDIISASDTSVLITGESGTGKELIASAIQENSPRKTGPFIKINCSALTETLLESELFGHEKGAFTGAVQEKRGIFEAADRGTVFLDEVGDMSLGLQAKLLRLLQEQEFQRVGGHRTIKVDVRVLAATNKDLKQEIRAGRFREDIYYRLCVIPIHLEPLRQRREDIPLLVHHFMEIFRQKYRRPIEEISQQALHLLTRHAWPGNVRELQNVIEYAFVCCGETRIRREHLPADLRGPAAAPEATGAADAGLTGGPFPDERRRITELLQSHRGNRSEVARLLGISRTTLWRRMKQHGIADIR